MCVLYTSAQPYFCQQIGAYSLRFYREYYNTNTHSILFLFLGVIDCRSSILNVRK